MNARQVSYERAFTIVELIVVIVVIGILAVVAVVAYNGVQYRAKNVQIISGARQYYDAIQTYHVKYGSYPKTSGEINGDYIALTCLGTGYPGGACGKVTNVNVYEDATFNAAMSNILGKIPRIGDNAIAVGSENFTGAVYGIDTTNITVRGRVIEYALYGSNTPCVIPKSYSYNVASNPPTTACEVYLEAYP
jgi:prepilin-type N-terminal cleavage/methylation domain-containing protein